MTTPRKISISEDELISRLYNKDRQAFSYLYDNYCGAIYGVIFRIIQNQEISQDVLQDCFVKIWNNFNQYDKTKGKLFTWMLNVARNLSIDATRAKNFKNSQQNLELGKVVNLIDTERNESVNPDQIGLRSLVNNMKPEYKAVIDLAYFQGFTQADIAKELGIPLGTVKTRMRAGIIELKEIFNK